jgi:hypothetical protein
MMAMLMCLGGAGVLLHCQFHRPYPFKIMLAGVVLLVDSPPDGCCQPFQQPAIPANSSAWGCGWYSGV